MGKKSKKRQSRKSRAPIAEAPTNIVSGPSVTATTSSEFQPDYSQTIKDLKRIGILAGTFFVVLVGLSFFLG